jgi:mono/diheme cytochrome c family protein
MGGQNVRCASGKLWAKLAAAAVVAGIGLVAWTAPVGAADTVGGDKPVDFKADIKPILDQSCVRCHRADPKNPRGPAAKLRLDDKEAAMKGGKSGVAIVPGKADESLLYKLLSGPVKNGEHEIAAMPKPRQRNEAFKPLSQDKIALIKKWIDQGAKWE